MKTNAPLKFACECCQLRRHRTLTTTHNVNERTTVSANRKVVGKTSLLQNCSRGASPCAVPNKCGGRATCKKCDRQERGCEVPKTLVFAEVPLECALQSSRSCPPSKRTTGRSSSQPHSGRVTRRKKDEEKSARSALAGQSDAAKVVREVTPDWETRGGNWTVETSRSSGKPGFEGRLRKKLIPISHAETTSATSLARARRSSGAALRQCRQEAKKTK